MNLSIKSCPQCGAELKIPVTNQPQHCDYCGTLIQPAATLSEKAQPAAANTPARPAPAEMVNLPTEYSQLRRPRPKTPVGGQGCFAMGFALFWTIFSAVFMMIGINTVYSEISLNNRMRSEGKTVQAVVTKLETDDSDDSTDYYVTYRFGAPVKGDLTQVTKRESVTTSTYNSLEVGQNVAVEYVLSDTSLSRLKSEAGKSNMAPGLVFGGTGGFFVLIGVVIIIGAAKSLNQLDDLRQQGRTTQGVLFDRWIETDSENSKTYLVAYAFQVTTHQGQIRTITRAEQQRRIYDKYKLGDSLTIRYLPNNPDICQVVL